VSRPFLLSGFLTLAVLAVTIGCADRASQLPEYGGVPAFDMTDSEGRPFSGKQLEGKVWIVDFIYTNCPGPCPRMTSQMHRVEQQVKSDQDVELLSISVDPDRDTPAVLNAFAKRFGGPTPHWRFLTGSPAAVHLLAHDVFKVGDVISTMDHSTKFMLVDKRGQLRGYYSTFDEDGLPNLLQDLKALRRQKS
jgi:protein SCO1/2